jgi:hypothetical protein
MKQGIEVQTNMENYTGPKYGKIGAKSPVDLRYALEQPLRRENISHTLFCHHAGPYREIEEFNFTFLSLIIDTSLSCDNISNNDLFTFVSLSFEIRKTSCNRS